MASKFQNRLVGTIILVALGVIVLPGLLDGKKKHYEDEFASIPLIPKPGDSNEMEALPALNPSLPSQPPEGRKRRCKTARKPKRDHPHHLQLQHLKPRRRRRHRPILARIRQP